MSYIQGSHGLTTTVKYSGAGWISGSSHRHTTTITSGLNGPKLYEITGTWTGESKFAKHSKDKKEGEVFLDADEHVERERVSVKPVEAQTEFESRRAWKAVADGIRSGDYDAASTAKGALENSERQKRKDEQAAGAPFQLRLFDHVPNDPEYAQLAALLKFKVRYPGVYLGCLAPALTRPPSHSRRPKTRGGSSRRPADRARLWPRPYRPPFRKMSTRPS